MRLVIFRYINLLLLIILFFDCKILAQEENLSKKLNGFFKEFEEQNNLSGVVLVADKGEIILKNGYGMANYEYDIRSEPHFKYRIGSLTKMFTAVAVLQLYEQGKLDIFEDFTVYLKKYPKPKHRITIHNLLTHTSGIPSFTSFADNNVLKKLPADVNKTIDRFKDKKLKFKPGTKYDYSNSNYILLGAIIESVSGNTYISYLKENILDPLKMFNTDIDDPEKIIKYRASGYIKTEEGIKNADYNDMSTPYAAGALYSTVGDLFLWDRALYENNILSSDYKRYLFIPNLNNYSYGFFVTEHKGHKIHWGSGGIDGFISFFIRFYEEDKTVIILCNGPIEKVNEFWIGLLDHFVE